MKQFLDNLKKDEQVSLLLRRLYEHFGYKKYKMSKFEEYGLYLENKDFLTSDQIITFQNADGRLLALKPDVTLSIVKNTNATKRQTEKLYYIENVFRRSKHSNEYQEISQMGLEFIGNIDLFSTWEVIHLALTSIEQIDSNFILDISHMGFIAGLFECMGIDETTKTKLLACMQSKNVHEIKTIAAQNNISNFYCDKLEKILSLSGEADEIISDARQFAVNDAMHGALDELKGLVDLINSTPFSKKIRLDFSIINHLDYYNGIIFQGFVKNVPRNVLSGGRYDLLLKKFNNNAKAIGFALYLNELSRFYPSYNEYDADIVIIYGKDANLIVLAQKVQELISKGASVQAVKNVPKDFRYKKLMKFAENTLEEVEPNA